MNNVWKSILGVLGAIIVLFLFWRFSSVVVYIVIAGIIAIMGQPLADLLSKMHIKKFKIPRWVAAAITLLAIWGVAVLFFALFIPLISNKVSELSQLDYHGMLVFLEEPMTELAAFLEKYFAVTISESSLAEMYTTQVGKIFNFSSINHFLTSIFSIAGSIGVAMFSISFIAFYFLKEEGLFLKMLYGIFPAKFEDNVKRAMGSISKLLSRYFLGVLAQSTIVMLIISVALLIFGFSAEDAFFSGLTIGVFNVIPYLGPWIGFGVIAITGLAFTVEGMGMLAITLTIAITVAFTQMVDNYVLQPMLYSKQVSAHPLEIFIVMLIAGSLGGVVGMLIAIPCYTVLRVFAKEFFYNYKLVRQLTEKI